MNELPPSAIGTIADAARHHFATTTCPGGENNGACPHGYHLTAYTVTDRNELERLRAATFLVYATLKAIVNDPEADADRGTIGKVLRDVINVANGHMTPAAWWCKHISERSPELVPGLIERLDLGNLTALNDAMRIINYQPGSFRDVGSRTPAQCENGRTGLQCASPPRPALWAVATNTVPVLTCSEHLEKTLDIYGKGLTEVTIFPVVSGIDTARSTGVALNPTGPAQESNDAG